MVIDPEKARGKKVHWHSIRNADDVPMWTPCGNTPSKTFSIPLEYYNRVNVNDRCKRCHRAFKHHIRGFPKVGQIREMDPSHRMLSIPYYQIITKVNYKGSSYRYYDVSVIEFTADLSDITTITYKRPMPSENIFSENDIYSDEDIEYIKTIYRIIKD